MILCGDLRFSHCQRHRYRPPREKWDTAQHSANARAGGIYRQADGVCQEWRCHNLGTSTTEWEWGKSKDAYCNRLRQKKIQESCIFQIINKQRKNKGKMGYELETSEFLSNSLFCITSKTTLFCVAKVIISWWKVVRIEEKDLLLPIFLQPNHYERQKMPYKAINIA